MTEHKYSTCKWCGEKIVWVLKEDTFWIPLNKDFISIVCEKNDLLSVREGRIRHDIGNCILKKNEVKLHE